MSVRRLILAPAATAAVPASAPAYTMTAAKTMSFTAKASNGYEVLVSGTAGNSKLFVMATKHSGATSRSVQYTVPGTVKSMSLKANLGALGKIDVDFEPRQTRIIKSKGCKYKGKPAFTTGIWKGTIRFKGELGYTKLSAKRAKGAMATYPKATCKNVPLEDVGKTVQLTATVFGTETENLVFSAMRTGTRKPLFGATLNTTNGDSSISRTVNTTSGRFSPSGDLESAALTAGGGVFAGRGTYVHDPEAGDTRSFTGDLSVAFPGLAGRYPHAGPDVGGFLERY